MSNKSDTDLGSTIVSVTLGLTWYEIRSTLLASLRALLARFVQARTIRDEPSWDLVRIVTEHANVVLLAVVGNTEARISFDGKDAVGLTEIEAMDAPPVDPDWLMYLSRGLDGIDGDMLNQLRSNELIKGPGALHIHIGEAIKAKAPIVNSEIDKFVDALSQDTPVARALNDVVRQAVIDRPWAEEQLADAPALRAHHHNLQRLKETAEKAKAMMERAKAGEDISLEELIQSAGDSLEMMRVYDESKVAMFIEVREHVKSLEDMPEEVRELLLGAIDDLEADNHTSPRVAAVSALCMFSGLGGIMG